MRPGRADHGRLLRQKGWTGPALAAVSSLGYLGFLAGPPIRPPLTT